MTTLSSHVLDTALGKPASNLALTLTAPNGEQFSAITNDDGRCAEWQGLNVQAGQYTLRFHTGDYLSAQHGSAFYPYVDVTFVVDTEQPHYHIPLLISPYGFSSYRGS